MRYRLWLVWLGVIGLLSGCALAITPLPSSPTGSPGEAPASSPTSTLSVTPARAATWTPMVTRTLSATRTAVSSPISTRPAAPQPTRTLVAPTLPTATVVPISTSVGLPNELEAEVIVLINRVRAERGLSALVVEDRLMAAAQAHSQDMATHGLFSHTGSDGATPADRLARQGYDWSLYAENLGCGYTSPADLVQGWMDSSGHCDNMLLAGATHVGVSLVYHQDKTCTYYWTALFAQPVSTKSELNRFWLLGQIVAPNARLLWDRLCPVGWAVGR